MTNKIAIALGLCIILLFVTSAVMGWDIHIFLGRKLGELIEYLAFWR